MIKIGDKEYNNHTIKVTWGNFRATVNGIKEESIAPFISFNIENNIFIGLEFVFSKEKFESMNLNEKINMNKYISDITYEDDKGWVSIVYEKFDCDITKLNNNEFRINFYIESEELDRKKLIIEDCIKLF